MGNKFMNDGPRFFVLVLRGISIALSVFYIVAFAVDVAPILGLYENVELFLDRMLTPLGYILGIWIIYSISAMIVNFIMAFLQSGLKWGWEFNDWSASDFKAGEQLNVRTPLKGIQTFRWNGDYVSMGKVPVEFDNQLRPVGSVISNVLAALGFSEKRNGLNDGKIKFRSFLAPNFKSAFYQIARRPFSVEFDQLDDHDIDAALSTAVGKCVDHIYVPPDEFYYQVEL